MFWLKVFGCGAVEVPGKDSKDHYHAVTNPTKFDGLLPLLWRKDGNSIYQVPLRSTSLAHVIPRSAIVGRRPIHGLDIEPVRLYLAALEDANLPTASIKWLNPEYAEIRAEVAKEQVVSVQITYDPGWQATERGILQTLRSDQLGFLLIEPSCTGDCVIQLRYTGGWEQKICATTSMVMTCVLMAMLFLRSSSR